MVWLLYLKGSVSSTVELSLTPGQAFNVFTDEIKFALIEHGMKLEETASSRKVMEGNTVVGTVKDWVQGKKISVLWQPATWDKGLSCELNINFVALKGGGTMVSVEQTGWGRIIGDDGRELLGWFASETAALLMSATSPYRLGDWITDRRARRPSGARSGGFYRDPIYHKPNFLAILDVLALRRTDRLLEIGCGGGAFLHAAMKSGCSASAIDHSPYMVRLASEVNRESISKRRLSIRTGEAGSLPYQDGSFTCAVMTGVLGFLEDPLLAFKEVCRVLERGGRFVVFTGSKELRGTAAAPEPVASRLHFYEDQEIAQFARLAGFGAAKVEHPLLFKYAKKSRVPESDLNMFRGTAGSQLLIASKV